MVSKYAQLVAIQGKPPPHEIPTIMLDCHRGAYDQLIRDHDDRIVFSGTKEFGDDWQACKKHHEALMAPLMDKSPGDDIRGLLQQLTGFNGIIKPLPYDKNVRSDGLTTPHDRMKYDNE